MNPIENTWSLMKKNLKACDYALNSDALFDALDSIWNELSTE